MPNSYFTINSCQCQVIKDHYFRNISKFIEMAIMINSIDIGSDIIFINYKIYIYKSVYALRIFLYLISSSNSNSMRNSIKGGSERFYRIIAFLR